MAMLVLLSIFALLYLYHLKLQNSRKFRLLKDLPGPKPHFLIGNLAELILNPIPLFYYARSLNNQYKRISKFSLISEIAVNVNDPDDIEILLSSPKYITKGRAYELVHPWLGDGLLIATGEKWQTRRKILTPAFHFNILKQFCTIFSEQGVKLVEKIRPEVGKEVELLPFLTEYTLNAIAETAMGTSLDDRKGNVGNYRKAIFTMGDVVVERFGKPWLQLSICNYLTETGQKFVKALTILHNFTMNVIKERREERKKYGNRFEVESTFAEDDKPKKRLALLDLLLTAESEGKIDEGGIRQEVDTFMFEGHDTTTMAMIYLLMNLANNRDIQDRVAAEIIEIFPENDPKITIDKLNMLNYTERCIKESLRLYPSVPFISRRISEDMQLKNCYLAAETECSIHSFDIHRNADYFPDPDRFDPDRFLPENCLNRHPFAYIPFSAGPRNCIGQKFALLEEKTGLVAILKNFILEPVTRPEDLIFIADIVLRTKNPVKIKFILR